MSVKAFFYQLTPADVILKAAVTEIFRDRTTERRLVRKGCAFLLRSPAVLAHFPVLLSLLLTYCDLGVDKRTPMTADTEDGKEFEAAMHNWLAGLQVSGSQKSSSRAEDEKLAMCDLAAKHFTAAAVTLQRLHTNSGDGLWIGCCHVNSAVEQRQTAQLIYCLICQRGYNACSSIVSSHVLAKLMHRYLWLMTSKEINTKSADKQKKCGLDMLAQNVNTGKCQLR